MKAKLIRLIEASRRKESEVLMPHVDDSEPEAPGRWTTRDVVAHMTSWRQVAIGEVRAVLTGSEVPDVSSDDDVENEKFYAQTHHLPARAIVEAAARSWDDLASAVEACTEQDLEKPRPRYPNQKLLQAVTGNSYYHVAEHIGYWYDEQGNEAEAEKAALWGYDLVTTVLPDDRTRGAAEYNLACLYAKRGRTEQALTHLGRGFELRPDLKDWSKSDTDLDSIRSDPEFVKLLE
ncbi:MAG TPA: DinB family protein [Candidatus Dormibacteraeota bacterium]